MATRSLLLVFTLAGGLVACSGNTDAPPADSGALCYEGDDPCESVVCLSRRQCVLTLEVPQDVVCSR